MKKINTSPFVTPESLKVLGIRLCPDCGAHLSVENSICYGCGFIDDDLFVHEAELNGRYAKGDTTGESLFLVYRKKNSYIKDATKTFHLMKNEVTLCGSVTQKTNQFELVGKMTLSRIPTFYKNPCKGCLDKLENNHF